ncbi:hypothetical protein KUTeg_006182 [Tegillarca granosa]|uniref:Uncharacterized protein n=1 Tax=Tegillarca granosa TaxID=220873 RepID=A0ABQ9FKC6_TEGGR|nr:hypothetical protein KUTeg_006182 [Tegillarca granosa]
MSNGQNVRRSNEQNVRHTVQCNDNPATISVVTDSEFKVQDHIQILNPPNVLSNGELFSVEYKCSDERIVGLEIITYIEKYKKKKIFQKVWKCSSGNNDSKVRRVKLKLKDKFAYRPDIFNKDFQLASRTKLQAWILDPAWWTSAKRNHNAYSRSKIKVSYNATILPPYSRPQKKIFGCLPWSWQIILDLSTTYISKCPKEHEKVDAITFPVALNGLPYGVIRTFEKFSDEGLEYRRQAFITTPAYTVSMWLYILEYCVHAWNELCSFMHHVTWDGKYLSPVIFMNKEGKLHIQVLLNDGQTNAALTAFAVPKHSWFRLVLTLYNQMWTLTLNYGEDLNETITTNYNDRFWYKRGSRNIRRQRPICKLTTIIPGTVYLDDTTGLFTFGGFEYTSGFKGYIGQATIYRNKALYHDAIPFPSPYHPMFELSLSKREERCKGFIEWTDRRVKAFRLLREIRKYRDTCQNYFSKYVRKFLPISPKDQCLSYEGFRPRHYRFTNRSIRRSVLKNGWFDRKNASELLYQQAVEFVVQTQPNIVFLEYGFSKIKKAVKILKQSACYGDSDAMYLLAVILNNGITVKADEIQAQAYLMMGSMDKHRLSSMALAHKHNYGLDGVPFDKDQAYKNLPFYLKTKTFSMNKHSFTFPHVFTESIRLTNEAQLREQTDEDGDIFHWLQHQAQKGVFSAQQHMARALFWGSNGLRRNMQAAIDYFRMGAETQDPQAMYDYGIVVLKGQGTKKNVTEGLNHIKRSAEKKNPAALNALGWYALNYDHNVTQAKEYFEQAYRYGNADAAYNLGWMHQMGKYPDKPVDVDLALKYYNFAAVRNQIDAGVQVAHINSKGTNILPRNNVMAVE